MTGTTKRTRTALAILAVVAVIAIVFLLFGVDARSRSDEARPSDVARDPTSVAAPLAVVAGSAARALVDEPVVVGTTCRVLVVDARSREPLSAEVELRAIGTERSTDVRTTEAGACAFACADLRDADVFVRSDGRLSAGLRNADVRAALAKSPDVTVEMHELGELTVRVVDEGDRPIARAAISVVPADPTAKQPWNASVPYWWPRLMPPQGFIHELRSETYVPSWTDEAGTLTLRCLPRGVPLFVEATGTVPRVSDVVVIDAATGFAELTLRGLRSATLRGRLVRASGAPAAAVNVRNLGSRSSSGGYDRAESDPDGRWTLEGVAPGPMTFAIDSSGERPRSVVVDEAIEDVGTIVLEDVHELSGHVVDACVPPSSSAPRTRIRAIASGSLASDFTSDAGGDFRQRLPEGRYVLELVAGSRGIPVAEVDVPGPPVELPLAAAWGSVRIRGVAERDGLVVRALEIGAERVGAGRSNEYSAGPGGVVRREGEDLVVCWVAPGEQSFAVGSGTPTRWRGVGSVRVTAGAESVLDASSATPGTIRGRVVDGDDRALPGFALQAALVDLETLDRGLARTDVSSDADGEFVICDLPPGDWVVFPRSLGPRAPDAQRVRLEPGGDQRVVVRSGTPGTVVVRVRVGDDPIAGARVYLRPIGEAYSPSASTEGLTDAAGVFTSTGVAPGRYSVAIGAQVGAERMRDRKNVELAAGGRVEVDFDCGCAPLEIECTWNGERVADISAAHVFGRDGGTTCRLTKERDLLCCLTPGRWLFQVERLRHASSPSPKRAGGIAIGVLDVTAASASGRRTLRLGEGRVRVRLRDDSMRAALPSAGLVEVDGIDPGLRPGLHMPLAYEDDRPRERVFLYVPAGARLQLTGNDAAGAPRSLMLDVADERELVVDWP